MRSAHRPKRGARNSGRGEPIEVTRAYAHLEPRGIVGHTLEELCITACSESMTARLFNQAVTSLCFQYLTIHRELREILTYRWRFTADIRGSFGAVSTRRFTQMKGAIPAAYFAASIDWPHVIARNAALLITEGEAKAIATCLVGVPTIALGGVDNFRSRARGWDLLPELEKIPWRNRRVFIVFDSDAATNPNVRAAERTLANELSWRGARVDITRLPELTHG